MYSSNFPLDSLISTLRSLIRLSTCSQGVRAIVFLSECLLINNYNTYHTHPLFFLFTIDVIIINSLLYSYQIKLRHAQIMHSNLFVSQMRSTFSCQLLWLYGIYMSRGSIAMAKLFSTICQITLESRLPANYKHGFVLIQMSHIFPLESIKKSNPNI